MPRLTPLVLPTLGLFLSSCASASSCGPTRAGAPDRVHAAALLATGAHDVYEALRLSRPLMLGTRAPRKDAPIVYVDGIRIGDVASLRRLPVRDVAAIRHLSGPDATTRYGTNHVGGALLVTTRLGGPGADEPCRT